MAERPSSESNRDDQPDLEPKGQAASEGPVEPNPASEADTQAPRQTEAGTEGKTASQAAASDKAAPAEQTAAGPGQKEATAGQKEATAGQKEATAGQKAAPAGQKPAAAGRGAARAKAARTAGDTVAAGSVQIEVERPPGWFGPWLRSLIRQTPSWLVSMVVHVVVILVLALLTLPPPILDETGELVVAPDEEETLEELEELDNEPLEEINFEVTADLFESEIEQEVIDVSPFDEMQAATVSVELSDIGLDLAPKADLLNQVGAFQGDALDGRGSGKAQLVARDGGTEKSERAVALGLLWLAEHQMPDGGWSFNHALHPRCRGQCRNPGNIPEARNGATGMALLPFLGAGQTHKQGKYKEQVRQGLYFLVNHMKVSPQGGSLHEGGGHMYSHGIASIVLCEAYAMTHDKGLYAPAQQALNYIAYAQDPVGGGWRYSPRQPGDTSVVGWQIMAMKSGHMAYLRVPPVTVQKAFRFLDSVQANNGAHYGYTDPAANREGTTAVGLLCRMYLGWKKDNPALQRGVKWISDRGPSPNNLYYNYYATQVMRHWEGERWDKWNSVMRDQLVSSQAEKGHEKGSWFMEAGHVTDRGGRLYCTSMATMILEVYYRHLPIYRKESTEEDFPID